MLRNQGHHLRPFVVLPATCTAFAIQLDSVNFALAVAPPASLVLSHSTASRHCHTK